MTTTPAEIPPRLSEMLTPSMGAPLFVDVRPRADSEFNDCTEDVRRQIEEHGGTAVPGWTVWERPGTFLFTEFHAVWKSPSGASLDVSTKADGETCILFLPDASLRYTGSRIHGKHLPLTNDPIVLEYIRAHEVYWEAHDRVYGSDYLGVLYPHPDMIEPVFRHELASDALSRYRP